MGVKEAIAEVFSKCSPNNAGVVTEFAAVVKVLWPILDNNVSLCDLSGIFTISIPASNDPSSSSSTANGGFVPEGGLAGSASSNALPSNTTTNTTALSPLRKGGQPGSPSKTLTFAPNTTGGGGGASPFMASSNSMMMMTNASMQDPAASTTPGLDAKLFTEFLTAIAQIKFGSAPNGLEKLLNEIMNAKSVHFGADTALFNKLIDRNVIRVMLKYDLPLRRAFCAFAGGAARVGGRLSWDEVKAQNIGMEVRTRIICRQ